MPDFFSLLSEIIDIHNETAVVFQTNNLVFSSLMTDGTWNSMLIILQTFDDSESIFSLNFLIFAANVFRYKRDDILFTLNEFELKKKRQEEFLSKEIKNSIEIPKTERDSRIRQKCWRSIKKKLQNFFRYLLAGNRRKKNDGIETLCQSDKWKNPS